jgi:hypothetical protein
MFKCSPTPISKEKIDRDASSAPRWRILAGIKAAPGPATELLHRKIAPADIFIRGKAGRILVMDDRSFIDDKCLLGNP